MNKYLLSLIILCASMENNIAQTVMPLYPDAIPNSKPVKDQEFTDHADGILRISKISRPTLTVYLPPKAKANGTAVVICPGGGYGIVAAKHEGADVAKVFNSMGVAAFVLKYRIPDDSTMIDRSIGPLQDAQQAMKTVRDNAKKWSIDPAKVGILGFSAGGHLAATMGTHYDKSLIPNATHTSLRPDFLILIYPVISFTDSIGHMGSRDQLLGKNPSAEQIVNYSNEQQVTDSTPPSFLVHASDDGAVNPKNSILFYEALLQHHVPAELHIYQSGGHGFGLFMKTSKDLWMDRCRNWMNGNGWLKIKN
jgi:acetyl esterase/lipase